MGKRASAAAGSPAKRAKAEVTARIKQVEKVLLDADLSSEVPMESREMLAQGAACALRSAVEERHAMQEKVLGYIQAVLSDMGSRLSDTKAAAEAASAEASSTLEASRDELSKAAEALSEAQKALDAQQERLSEASQALSAAEAELKRAGQGVKASQKVTDGIEKEKAKYVDFLEKPEWKSLMAGEYESDKERNKLVQKVVSQFQRLGAEDALLASAPAALSKKPEERQGFDTMVLDSLVAVLKEGEKACDGRLQEVAEQRAGLDAEAAAKTTFHAESLTAWEAESDEASKRKAVVKEKECGKADCEAKVGEHTMAVEARGEERDAAEEAVAGFAEVVQALDFLAARSLAPPPEPEPEAAAADPAPAEEAPPPAEGAAAA